MEKLSKSQFMSKVVNDLYERDRAKKQATCGANTHGIENVIKIKNKNFRRKR